MASAKGKAPKEIFLLELIRKTNHARTGEPIVFRDYRLYETLSAAKGKRTTELKYSRNWNVTGNIYKATVDWTPLPEYEDSVHEDMLSRLEMEIENG